MSDKKKEVNDLMPTITRRSMIAGPVPNVKGLYVMRGCQEAGVTHGPGLGRILSEYALDNKTTFDSGKFDPARFSGNF